MKKTTILFFFLLSFSFAFGQTAKIKTFPVSPYMIEHGEIDTNIYKSEYTGLKVVGLGELVYLISKDQAASYGWSITSAPAGSAAALDNIDLQMTTFRPDVIGDYTIKLEVGSTSDEIIIVVSNFIGMTAGNCGLCHSTQKSEMETTGHTTIFIRALEGTLSGHYSASCVKCHTVGYNAEPEAVNNGFDDVATTLGWTLPTPLTAGNWDALDASLKNLSNVQCESCHGPASQHLASFSKTKMDVTLESGMCAKCHDDGHYHRRPLMWSKSAHSMSNLNTGATRSGCNDCHSGSRFVELIDKTPGIQYNAANTGAIGCAVCHDPHDSHDNHDPMLNSAGQEDVQKHHLRSIEDVTLTNGEVVTLGGTGKLCMNCHKSRREAESYVASANVSSHFGPHYSTQTDMIMGTNAITFGRYLPSSTHKDVLPDFCVTCHMAETPGGRSGFGTYGRDEIGDHTFKMHWAGDDGVLFTDDDAYNIGICQDCHGDSFDTFDEFPSRADHDGDGTVETAREEIHGLLHDVEMLLPPVGEATINYSLPFSPIQRRALFNYAFVEEDHSFGMHNFQYAINLLKVTIEALNYGTLAKGEILGIYDVPNDQGKQVFISWTRFGGDGVSNDPVTDYVILRKDMTGNLGKVNPTYSSMDQVPGDVNKIINSTVSDNGVMWTIVAATPAIQFLEYNMVVPTIYDSSASGLVETTFKVVGVTANGLSAETDEKSGYSIDNLAPVTPSGLMGAFADGRVGLQWDEAVDKDFQYFAIYRSNIAGFDPSQSEPYATTVSNFYEDEQVENGKTYYYKIAAFDFSGNMSNLSAELPIIVTSLNDIAGIPTEFSLSQNYPNPFNPTTEIKFGLPEASHVKVTIYNSVGKEISVLVNKNMQAGFYTYTWSASNIATGVYFYEMKTNNFTQVKKMLLVK